MTNELWSPLADVIRKAAQSTVEGPAARLKKRFENAGPDRAVLCDCSGSMADLVGSSGLSKYQHMVIALKDVLQSDPKIRLVAFASRAKAIPSPEELPNPMIGGALGSGTNLGDALLLAARWKPRRTIVISDGLPDSEDYALQAVDKLTGAVDTIYCGPDAHPAIQFLRKLSRSAGGSSYRWDGYPHELTTIIRGLLPAPE